MGKSTQQDETNEKHKDPFERQILLSFVQKEKKYAGNRKIGKSYQKVRHNIKPAMKCAPVTAIPAGWPPLCIE
jgi:hypothetical protein